MQRNVTTATYVQQVNRAVDHIVAHLDRPLRLHEVARVSAISPFHFHRVFQAVIGETPAEFSKRLRLEKALRLMAFSGRRSLTAIAFECGFQSSSDFSRSFKKHFGSAPRSFDLESYRAANGEQLALTIDPAAYYIDRLPPRRNPDAFKPKIRSLPPRQVAYIRVSRPYQGNRVFEATQRLLSWAERHSLADGQWLGYQWDNPEITRLENCQYYVAIEAHGFRPRGEIGQFEFPPMTVAEVELKGGIELELRALQWLYGTWLPRTRFVPDDHPGFEAWIGRPFEHGTEYFELNIQLPIRVQ